MSDTDHFADFVEAFDVCRERNHPITCWIDGEFWKLYPSGRSEKIDRAAPLIGARMDPKRNDIMNNWAGD